MGGRTREHQPLDCAPPPNHGRPFPRAIRPSLTLVAAAALAPIWACSNTPTSVETPAPPEPRDWRDEIVYQLLTDRFADGDPANDGDAQPACALCNHGGDWRGIMDHLDYLEGLGITAIWISPVTENADSPVANADGYHGFWPRALDRANPRFGSRDDLRALVDAAHAKGIKIIVDVVLNHLGPVAFYDVNHNGQLDSSASELRPPFRRGGILDDTGAAPAPLVFFAAGASPSAFQNPDWYHRRGEIQDWEDPEQALTGDFRGGLRDLDTSRDDVRAALLANTLAWIDDIGFDGIRYDTAKHIEMDFWVQFLAGVRAHPLSGAAFPDGLLQVAEVFDGDIGKLGDYTKPGRFDAVLNFAGKYRIYDEVFGGTAPTTALEAHYIAKEAAFAGTHQAGGLAAPPRRLACNFLDNHDVPRFANGRSTGALGAALAYLLLSDGIPIIYYGTEQEFSGAGDPDNREDLWTSDYSRDGQTFAHIANLARLRRDHVALRRGDTRFVWTTDHQGSQTDANLVAFERFTATERLLVVINTGAGSLTGSVTAYLGNEMQTGFAPGTTLSYLFGGPPDDRLTVGDDGRLSVSVAAYGAKVLAGP